MRLTSIARMYTELEKLGYDMEQFHGLKPIISPVYNQLNEDLKTLKLRYPNVPVNKINALKSKYGAIIADCILSDDYHLYKGDE